MTQEVKELWTMGPDVRSAAERVASDWPCVTTADELTADLSLYLLEKRLTTALDEMPSYRRAKFLDSLAREIVNQEVAEYEFLSGNSVYSVSQVRGYLESGALLRSRERITTIMPDLDEGCRYLRATLPRYAYAVYLRYVLDGGTLLGSDTVLNRAVEALTDVMNNLNKNRPANRGAH